jgi:hypothetical protein
MMSLLQLLGCITAVFALGVVSGAIYESRKPLPLPPVCHFQGYYIPTTIAAATKVLIDIDPEGVEICVRYRGAIRCEAMLPSVEAVFRNTKALTPPR